MTGTSHTLKRRHKGLTDYRKRKRYLVSRKPRLVSRTSNRYTTAAIVSMSKDGERTIVSASSKELKKLGWRFGLNNVPAAYLTGCLLAKRASGMDLGEVILDIGLATPTKGNKSFALAKGCSDSGLRVLFNESVAPAEERIRGEHLVSFASSGQVGNTFSALRAEGVDLKSMPDEFSSFLSRIREGRVG